MITINQTHLLSTHQDDGNISHIQETSHSWKKSRFRIQECLSILQKCKNMEHFKQVQAQFLKLGIFHDSPFCASNLVSTCALSEWGSMDYACAIFAQIESPCAFDFNVMIRGYADDYWEEESALAMFAEMLERGIETNRFTYPSLLKCIARLSGIEEGMQIHGQILKLGFEDDLFVQNSLINLYGKCEKIEFSCSVFEKMKHRSVASWSAIIAAHAQVGMWTNCLALFHDMKVDREGQCLNVDESILGSMLSACTHLNDLDLGRCIHGFSLRTMSGLNVVIHTSLIDMYAKCGDIRKGLCIFRSRIPKDERNRLTYSVMISGLAMHGHGRDALGVFSEMLDDGWAPDDVVYLGVLSACRYVKEGLEYLSKMKHEHGIEPTIQHYGCLVNLMGRNGMLSDAFHLLKTMPVAPNDVCWRSLLNACSLHRNSEMGEIVANILFESSSLNTGDYLLVSDIYAKEQRWDKVAETRKKLASRKDLNQVPGFSSVSLLRKTYKFVSQDISRPQCEGVYEMIYNMEWQLQFHGYSPDISQVLVDVDDEAKRQRLSAHSQKLAIAFALIHTCPKSTVRIVRNLRMCSDCHTYAKLISTAFEREIIVRERNVFHHFKDGACSCEGYW